MGTFYSLKHDRETAGQEVLNLGRVGESCLQRARAESREGPATPLRCARDAGQQIQKERNDETFTVVPRAPQQEGRATDLAEPPQAGGAPGGQAQMGFHDAARQRALAGQ